MRVSELIDYLQHCDRKAEVKFPGETHVTDLWEVTHYALDCRKMPTQPEMATNIGTTVYISDAPRKEED